MRTKSPMFHFRVCKAGPTREVVGSRKVCEVTADLESISLLYANAQLEGLP